MTAEIGPRVSDLPSEHLDVLVALLTLGGPEVCVRHRARWAEIAEEARRVRQGIGERAVGRIR